MDVVRLFLLRVCVGCMESAMLRLSRHGFGAPIGCLWAWWLLSWRGWRTDWCLRRDPPNRLRWLPGGHRWRQTGNADPSWNPARFLSPNVGRAVCGWAIRWTFGTSWSHEGRQYRDGTCAASWLLRWTAPTSSRLLLPTVYGGLFLPSIYGLSAWYEPSLLTTSFNSSSYSNSSWATRHCKTKRLH